MMDPATAYFLKRYYPHVIKWWLVVYNPQVVRIWPSKTEKEEALRLEAEQKEQLALEQHEQDNKTVEHIENSYSNTIDKSAYNAATGSYSGLYGQRPVDADTQAALDAIMNISNNQNSIDSLLSGGQPTTQAACAPPSKPDNKDKKSTKIAPKNVILPPEQEEIIQEANAIYERLMREAAEDEAKKQIEIEEARKMAEQNA